MYDVFMLYAKQKTSYILVEGEIFFVRFTRIKLKEEVTWTKVYAS